MDSFKIVFILTQTSTLVTMEVTDRNDITYKCLSILYRRSKIAALYREVIKNPPKFASWSRMADVDEVMAFCVETSNMLDQSNEIATSVMGKRDNEDKEKDISILDGVEKIMENVEAKMAVFSSLLKLQQDHYWASWIDSISNLLFLISLKVRSFF